MNRRLVLLTLVVVALAACGVPEVEMDLPERPGIAGAESGVSPTSPSSTADDPASGLPETGDGSDPAPAPPDPEELDELDQLVREIEALLEGVSEELDQITFEEEGE